MTIIDKISYALFLIKKKLFWWRNKRKKSYDPFIY